MTPNVKFAMYCTDPKLVELIEYRENIRSRREKAIRISIQCRRSGLLAKAIQALQYKVTSLIESFLQNLLKTIENVEKSWYLDH